MAGHSKWANIQYRKRAQDSKRGKVFTKLIREITMAARTGGGDPIANPRLRLAVDKALSANMTRDTIDRAVKRGAGSGEADNLENITYEGYGPGGVAVLVECLTDNRNRTVGDVRHAFTKHGGNLGTDGSVAYLFDEKGQLFYPPGQDEEQLLDIALEVGADDVKSFEDGSIEIITRPDNFSDVKAALIDKGLNPEAGEVAKVAQVLVEVRDEETQEKLNKLLERLEDLDDVQNVYTNADL